MAADATLTISSKLINGSDWTKVGEGTLKLTSDSNTNSGRIKIAEGTIWVDGGSLGTSNVEIASEATLQLSDVVLDNTISGEGEIVVKGGTVDLSGSTFDTTKLRLTNGILVLRAGQEGTAETPLSIPSNVKVQIILNETLALSGYPANVTLSGGSLEFLDTLKEPLTEDEENRSDTGYTPLLNRWTKGTTNKWYDTTNWSNGVLPGATDSVVISIDEDTEIDFSPIETESTSDGDTLVTVANIRVESTASSGIPTLTFAATSTKSLAVTGLLFTTVNIEAGALLADSNHLEAAEDCTVTIAPTAILTLNRVFGAGTLVKQGTSTLKLLVSSATECIVAEDITLDIQKGCLSLHLDGADNNPTFKNVFVRFAEGTTFTSHGWLNIDTATSITTLGNIEFTAADNVTPSIMGTGILTKKGTGTLTFDLRGQENHNNPLTIEAGTVELKNGTYSAKISGSGSVCISGEESVTLSVENDYSGGTMVKNGATLEITNREALGSAAVTGCGTVVYDGDAALPNAPTWFATGTVSTGWRGTVLIKNVPDDNPDTELVFERYGNAHSTVELTDVCGYLGTQSFEGTLKLTDESASVPALKIVNGWTDTNNPRVITVQRLAGDGTFQGANGTYDYGFVFKDVADFTGSIKLATGDDRGTGVVLGGTDYNHGSYERKIVVANGATLTAPLVLDGTLLLPETVSDMLTVRVSGDMPEGGYPVLTNVGSESWTVPETLTVNTRVVNGTTSMSVAGLKLEVKTANDVAGLYLVQPEIPVKIPSAEVLGVIDAAPKPEGVTMIAEVVVQGTGTEALATHSVEAVEVFGNILTVTPTAEGATTGTATIAYDFGIEGITMDAEGNVVLTVKVQNSVTENTAEIINPETTLKVYLNGSDTPLEGIIVNGDGATATITIPAEKVADLKTHTFRVNAEK